MKKQFSIHTKFPMQQGIIMNISGGLTYSLQHLILLRSVIISVEQCRYNYVNKT